MLKKKDIFPTICISFTLITLCFTILDLLKGNEFTNATFTILSSFVWSAIAVIVLSLHSYFERLSTLVMIVLQYLIALILVFVYLFICGLITPLHPDAYKDVCLSFTVPYIIGAIIYYISLFRYVKRQNKLLEEIKKIH